MSCALGGTIGAIYLGRGAVNEATNLAVNESANDEEGARGRVDGTQSSVRHSYANANAAVYMHTLPDYVNHKPFTSTRRPRYFHRVYLVGNAWSAV